MQDSDSGDFSVDSSSLLEKSVGGFVPKEIPGLVIRKLDSKSFSSKSDENGNHGIIKNNMHNNFNDGVPLLEIDFLRMGTGSSNAKTFLSHGSIKQVSITL